MSIKFDMSDLFAGEDELNDLIEDAVLEVSDKLTLDVHRNVVIASPVDTGVFRGAWTVETPSKAYGVGKVENATPYGPYLVDGHSDQAPSGWLDNAIESATRLGGKR